MKKSLSMSEVKSRPQRKPCIACNQQKPDDGFYWYAYTTQQGKPSVRRESRCLECARQRRRDRYAKDPSKDNAWSLVWKSLNKEQAYAGVKAYRDTPHGRAIIRAAMSKRRTVKMKRTPAWADLEAIKDVYKKAAVAGMVVDHIIPLQGKLVSGLHVPSNLQLLSSTENSRKKNRFAVA